MPTPATCSASTCRAPSACAEGCPRRTPWRAWLPAAKALGDATRLAVALAVRDGERVCVCDLAWIVGRDERLVSHHVRQLRAAGLAASERDGKMVLYELTERGRALLTAVTASEAPV